MRGEDRFDQTRPDQRRALMDRWRTRRDELLQVQAMVNGAMMCDQVLADLAALFDAEQDEAIPLTDAATQTGYSTDHLRRLAREGRIPAQHRGRRLFFRVGDLPRKPSPFDVRTRIRYDPDADARRVTARRAHRGGEA